MEQLTYQQILAQAYDETSKNLLVHPNEYEGDDQVEEHESHEYENHEVENSDEFNKFQPRHDIKNVIPAKDYEDKTRGSVRYDKDVKTHIVDVDSRFRAYPKASYQTNSVTYDAIGIINSYPASNVANFTFSLPKIIKNVITAKMTSISFPNIFYTFSKARENYGFNIYDATGTLYPPAVNTTFSLEIDDGNYKDINDLITVLHTKIQAIEASFSVTYDKFTNKIMIKNNSHDFGINFTPPTILQPFNSGMGSNLGYEALKYGTAPYVSGKEHPPQSTISSGGSYVLTAESFPDIYGDSYIYIGINDYDVIEHQNFKQSFFPVFAKLMLPFNTKNQLVTDIDLLYLVQRQYNFLQPINIQKLAITIYDAYGSIVDMKGANFSFTIQFEEILNPAMYEKMREL